MTYVTINGNQVDYDAAVILMDDELREALNEDAIQEQWTDQRYIDEYSKRHAERFGEQFVVN